MVRRRRRAPCTDAPSEQGPSKSAESLRSRPNLGRGDVPSGGQAPNLASFQATAVRSTASLMAISLHRLRLTPGLVVVGVLLPMACSLGADLDALRAGAGGAAGPEAGADAAGGSRPDAMGGASGVGGTAASSGIGGAAGAPADAGVDAGPCTSTEMRCDGHCVTTATNPEHCGGCGTECTAPSGGTPVCAAGTCDFVCGSLERCGARCIDLEGDPANCGSCGNECPPVSDGQPTCTALGCGVSCGAGFEECAGLCADVTSDPKNCGACRNACPTTQVCGASTCSDSCPPSLDDCSGACVELDTSVAHCGACGNRCPAPPNGSATCTAGVCGVACNGGYTPCGSVCVNTAVDPANCGACGTACNTPANGVATCAASACGVACNAGFANCGGACVDTATHPGHCGGCGNPCTGGQVCNQGSCTSTCPSGTTNCDGACVDTASSPSNCGACGNACSTTPNGTATCAAGACDVSCASGFTKCGGACLNTTSDPTNCGACANACSVPANGGATCSTGQCGIACNSGFTRCGTACVDTGTSTAHCGRCDAPCSGNEVCSGGSCTVSCSGTEVDCSGSCVNTATNPAHCGACDDACPVPTGSVATCSAQTCGFTCNAGLTKCGSACLATSTHLDNCGACGNACPAVTNGTRTCVGGQCGVSCNAGFSACAGNCVDTATNTSHCGVCGNACPDRANATKFCAAGNCGFVCSPGFVDCDMTASTGCEVDTRSSVGHCGACGVTCTNANGTTSCVGGVCVPACTAGWASCDSDPRNGCETQTATNPSHCGTCGNVCGTATPLCVDGACVARPETVSAGLFHSCATRSSGATYCWGYNLFGRLGNGTTTNQDTATAVSGITNGMSASNHGFDDVAFSCVARTSGQAACWGHRREGQLGDGGGSAGQENSPRTVSNLSDAVQLAAGTASACARRATGQVVCWGDRDEGRLGDGGSNAGFSEIPVAVIGFADAIDVSVGHRHACAVRAGGTVMCWGDRDLGRLGNNTSSGYTSTPTAVTGITNAVQVSAGFEHTCATLANGTARCWGHRVNDRLGDGGAGSGTSLTPVVVSGVSDAVHVSAGWIHSCAVRATGGIVCWGDRSSGRIGNGGSTAGTSATATAVSVITDAKRVDAGYQHSCATTASGTFYCWGYNAFGQLGDNSTTQRTTPVAVQGM